MAKKKDIKKNTPAPAPAAPSAPASHADIRDIKGAKAIDEPGEKRVSTYKKPLAPVNPDLEQTVLPLVVSGIVFGVSLPVAICFGTVYSFVWLALSVIFLGITIYCHFFRGGYKTKGGKICLLGITTLLVFFLGFSVYSTIPFGKRWQYPTHRRYIVAAYESLPEYFEPMKSLMPEKLPDGITDYSFSLKAYGIGRGLLMDLAYRCEGAALDETMAYYDEASVISYMPGSESEADITARIRAMLEAEAIAEAESQIPTQSTEDALTEAAYESLAAEEGMDYGAEEETEEIDPLAGIPDVIELPPVPDDFRGDPASSIVYIVYSDYCISTPGISFYVVIDPASGWVQVVDTHISR